MDAQRIEQLILNEIDNRCEGISAAELATILYIDKKCINRCLYRLHKLSYITISSSSSPSSPPKWVRVKEECSNQCISDVLDSKKVNDLKNKNAVSALNEYCQVTRRAWDIKIDKYGSDHIPIFVAYVVIDCVCFPKKEAFSKNQARKYAAEQAMNVLYKTVIIKDSC
ncbi:dsRNA-binding IFn resistance [Cetacean poxvirus 1]|nr:dsRNA-binding IFn resistance [Cetacean poxvirus 1]